MMLSIVSVVSRLNRTIGRYHKVQCRSLVEINPPCFWATLSSPPSIARLFPTSLCWTRLLHCRPGLTPCLAASRSMLRTRLSSSSATSARRRQTTVYGSPPPRSTTKVCDASFRICDPFRYSGRRSPAGRSFRPMRRISRRRRCAPASSLSPGILESARCRGRGGPRGRAPRRRGDPMSKQRLHVIKQRHEAEIHMQLLMTVKQGQAGIVGDEIYLGFLISAQHDDVFDHP